MLHQEALLAREDMTVSFGRGEASCVVSGAFRADGRHAQACSYSGVMEPFDNILMRGSGVPSLGWLARA